MQVILNRAAETAIALFQLQDDDAEMVRVYGRGLLLVRPDQHIAWRGTKCDDMRAADAIMSRVLGWTEAA